MQMSQLPPIELTIEPASNRTGSSCPSRSQLQSESGVALLRTCAGNSVENSVELSRGSPQICGTTRMPPRTHAHADADTPTHSPQYMGLRDHANGPVVAIPTEKRRMVVVVVVVGGGGVVSRAGQPQSATVSTGRTCSEWLEQSRGARITRWPSTAYSRARARAHTHTNMHTHRHQHTDTGTGTGTDRHGHTNR
jgi:hypothetical protein